jgi:pyruvate dehydrogenase E2 component (dihydrolipoamide acetyltransferase)
MDVKLPKLGEGAESGVVVSILVKPGDSVTQGQPLLEIENEKAVAPIPSPENGVVGQILVNEGDSVSVGTLLLKLKPADSTTAAEPAPGPAAAPVTSKTRPAATAASAPSSSPDAAVHVVEEVPKKTDAPIAASPAIRRLARELGIDLARVRGTERGGRIGMNDLRTYIERLQRIAFQRTEPSAPRPTPASAPATVEPIDFAKWGPVTRKPLSALRKTIGQRMSDSWLSTPRVTQFDEAELTRLNHLRKQFGSLYEAQGIRLTFTPFILKALAATLKQHPLFNSSLDEASGELVLKHYYHLGLAVDTEAGLIVPVIRDVDQKPLPDLAREVEVMAAKARDRKVALEELKGGTFTLSNQGGIGGGPFTPIVNKPEVAILGLGRASLKPAVREGRIEARLLVPLGLSYDHRVIDGASAARFIVDLVKAIEEFPETGVAP